MTKWQGTINLTYVVDCGNDPELSSADGTSSTDVLTHGTVNIFTCVTDECFVERTCNNGTWNGDMPFCQCETLKKTKQKEMY